MEDIYVSHLPESCEQCRLCMQGKLKLNKNGRYQDAKGCVLGDYYKYTTIDDEIDTCPLKSIDDMYPYISEYRYDNFTEYAVVHKNGAIVGSTAFGRHKERAEDYLHYLKTGEMKKSPDELLGD